MHALVIVLAIAAQKFEAPVLTRVEIARTDNPAVCVGGAGYSVSLTAAARRNVIGARGLSVYITTPCGRINAFDVANPLPGNAGNTLSVQTHGIVLIRRADNTCYAVLHRSLEPVDSDEITVVGRASVETKVDPVSCNALSSALTGATITDSRGWPTAQLSLPLPLAPGAQ